MESLTIASREMAAGNTFGATVLSSYGGFWISIAITFIPGGFGIIGALEEADKGSPVMFYNSFGLYLMVCTYISSPLEFSKLITQAWFIFTTMITFCTVKSTVAFFSLFFVVDIAILLIALSYFFLNAQQMPNEGLMKAGGLLAFLAAFLAWYNAFAGIADDSNSFFVVPVVHFPWSEKGRSA